MSVFEVIRYSETDLNSLKALRALPDMILLKYWLEVHKGTLEEFEPFPRLSEICHLLSRWAIIERRFVPFSNSTLRDKFLRALKEIEPL